MRLFTGLELYASVEAEVDRLVRPWREIAPAAKWGPLANLHITTKFIGEWPESRLAELKDALAGISFEPMRIHVRGVGWFPDAEHPHSLFAAVDGPPRALLDLAGRTQDALAELGIAREARRYTPHVTLARLNHLPAAQMQALREATAGAFDFGVIEASSFFLYLSQPEPRGSVYRKLAEFSIQ